jgi:hypothetical protein
MYLRTFASGLLLQALFKDLAVRPFQSSMSQAMESIAPITLEYRAVLQALLKDLAVRPPERTVGACEIVLWTQFWSSKSQAMESIAPFTLECRAVLQALMTDLAVRPPERAVGTREIVLWTQFWSSKSQARESIAPITLESRAVLQALMTDLPVRPPERALEALEIVLAFSPMNLSMFSRVVSRSASGHPSMRASYRLLAVDGVRGTSSVTQASSWLKTTTLGFESVLMMCLEWTNLSLVDRTLRKPSNFGKVMAE